MSSARLPDYGPPRDERELAQWADLIVRSFGLARADLPGWIAQLGPATVRVVRGREGPVSGLSLLDMGQWFGGRRLASGGIVAVAVDPCARGTGHGRDLMAAMLAELAGRGVPLSTLYPSTCTFYRALGYETAGMRYDTTLALRSLELQAPERAEGVWMRRLADSDAGALRELYTARARRSNGWLDRHPYHWLRVLNWNGEERLGYGLGFGDALEGFVFTVQRRNRGVLEQELGVGDAVAATPRAGVALLRFLIQQRTMCARAVLPLAPWDPLFAGLREEAYAAKVFLPWMLRVVDVAGALGGRGYAPALRGELALEVTDELLPANQGRFVLTVEGGAGHVARGGSGALRLSVRGLASLFASWQSASELALAGLCAGDAPTLALADALFAGPSPSMPDQF